MPKLNQIIAIEKGTKNRVAEKLTEVYKTFQKAALFSGLVKTWRPLEESQDSARYEALPDEKQEVQFRVADLLKVVREQQSELIDVSFARDVSNCTAKADIAVDGKVLVQQVPITHLLWLEKQLNDLHSEVKRIPTLDPAEKWEHNSDQNLFATKPIEQRRTKKVNVPLVLHPATKEHPAQVNLVTEDVHTGNWKITKYSGAMKAETRDEILNRVEKLQKAVKQAREEANMIDVPKIDSVGSKIFNFVLDGTV